MLDTIKFHNRSVHSNFLTNKAKCDLLSENFLLLTCKTETINISVAYFLIIFNVIYFITKQIIFLFTE